MTISRIVNCSDPTFVLSKCNKKKWAHIWHCLQLVLEWMQKKKKEKCTHTRSFRHRKIYGICEFVLKSAEDAEHIKNLFNFLITTQMGLDIESFKDNKNIIFISKWHMLKSTRTLFKLTDRGLWKLVAFIRHRIYILIGILTLFWNIPSL